MLRASTDGSEHLATEMLFITIFMSEVHAPHKPPRVRLQHKPGLAR